MDFGAVAPIVKIPGARKAVQTPGDAMQTGIHSDLRKSSVHKQMVSGVLHLKKESAGHRSDPTAYPIAKKAFKTKAVKKVKNV